MDFTFSYELSPEERNEIESFYDSLEFVTLEQFPAWAELEKGNFKLCFFIARENGKIVCSSVIIERKSKIFRFALIQFGPLFKEYEFLLASMEAIDKHYRTKGYVFLSVQLAVPTGNMADLIEYRLNKSLKIRTYFNRDNWSSIVLDLTIPEESIRSNFSKGHKGDLKKAEKNQISVRDLQSDEELDNFCKLYIKMFRERGLGVDEVESHEYFGRIRDFLKRAGRGSILVVRDNTGQMLGGIILLFQGSLVRYFKGASDPAFRQIPVLHLALWEGIKMAKAMGYKQFDFWGYNHFVTEKDQIFFINRFKKGFGGRYSFYPKKMYMFYKPLMYRLYRLLTSFQKKLSN